MPRYLAVRNWERYQHYKDGRRLTWIKLYIELLDDPDLRLQPADTRLLFILLLLVAGATDNCIPYDIDATSARTGLDNEATTRGLETLVKGRWLRVFRSRRTLEIARARERSREKRREEDPLTPAERGNRTTPRAAGTNPRAIADAAKRELHAQLLQRAYEVAAGWNGGRSDQFDEEIAGLERELGYRLTGSERIRLWDIALEGL